MRRAAIGQIVVIDRRDDHVVQAQARNRLGDTPRLVGIERTHFAMRDRAVGAITRAHVAHQHEGGRTMREALADIRTARLLADRMQPQLGQQRLGAEVLGRGRRAHLDPVGMPAFGHIRT